MSLQRTALFQPASDSSNIIRYRKAYLCGVIAAALACWSLRAQAAESEGQPVEFDSNFLPDKSISATNLSRFEQGNGVLPGNYPADLYLNTALMGSSKIRVAATSAKSIQPCINKGLLEQLKLDPAVMSADALARLQNPAECVDISSLIPDATAKFNSSELSLDVSVPQAYLSHLPQDYIGQDRWDPGVPAAVLNYTGNAYHSTSSGLEQSSAYLGLNAGINLGLWHFRNNSALNWQSEVGNSPAQQKWTNIDTYVQRDLPAWGALLTMGDSYTDGAIFDSVGLRGAMLATDDRMLPSSLRGYAPEIHGTAYTNAKVTVRQNGVQIYQTTVAPGPFVIKDLYSTGFGGSLDVTVAEADGRIRLFSVPYSSVVQLLRPHITRFSLAAGQLRNAALVHEPNVAQATLQHGFSNLFTGYTGVQGSEGYFAGLVGGAFNTPYGALALDVTHANAHIPGSDTQSGSSTRLSYSKTLEETHTSFSVATYRYSTSGFLNLSDAATARDYADRQLNAFTDYQPPTPSLIDGVPNSSILTPAQQAALSGNIYQPSPTVRGLQRQRQRFTLSLNQSLGTGWGSIYANASSSTYWNQTGTDTQYQVGYSNSFHLFSYSISVMRTRGIDGNYDNALTLGISVPLGSSSSAPSLSLNHSYDQRSGSQDQAALDGSLGSDDQFNYGISAQHGSDGTAGSLNAGYRSPYATFNGSVGSGNGYTQESLGISGAIVAHPGGVTLGQQVSMNDAIGILSVPGAAGIKVSSVGSGVSVDHFGYAVVPALTPYQNNTVMLDPTGLPPSVELSSTSAQVVPYAGSVVMLNFKTRSGQALLVRTHLENGQAPPLGSDIVNEKGESVGMIGQGGVALVRGVNQNGQLAVRWQDDGGADQACSFAYQLKSEQSAKGYEQISAECKKSTIVKG